MDFVINIQNKVEKTFEKDENLNKKNKGKKEENNNDLMLNNKNDKKRDNESVKEKEIKCCKKKKIKELKENNKENDFEDDKDSKKECVTINDLLNEEFLKKLFASDYKRVFPPSDFEQLEPEKQPDIISQSQFFFFPHSQSYFENKSNFDKNERIPRNLDMKGLKFFKQHDMDYFSSFFSKKSSDLTSDDKNELMIVSLLLKLKNGTQTTRRKSFRTFIENLEKFDSKILFKHIFALLVNRNLETKEKLLLIEFTNKIIFKMNVNIKPFTPKLLSVFSPLLIDDDFAIKMNTREIISNLTKFTGISIIVSSLKSDFEVPDEYVRNATSRVFSIVANTIGLNNFMPILKALIKSKKNWMIRHSGIKIIQQLCFLLSSGNGSSILPYLPSLINLLKGCLKDELLQVKTITALTISQLVVTVSPYGFDAFEPVLEFVYSGLKNHRGKSLASFIMCLGSILQLMSHDRQYDEYLNFYIKELLKVLVREFSSPDDNMKKTVLKNLIYLSFPSNILKDHKIDILTPFFKAFWNRKIASDHLVITKLLIDATISLSVKLDFLKVLKNVVFYLKDENELLRRLCVEAIHKMISLNHIKLIGLDEDFKSELVDGILYAFQEQTVQHNIYLQGLGSIVKTLSSKLKDNFLPVVSTALFRLKNKTPEIRQQSADLISLIAPVILKYSTDGESIVQKLILLLYELLGEVYPDVLGSIINALYHCIDCVLKESPYLMDCLPLNQVLPTLTPILKNRHEKVQESCIKLIELIAIKNAESINPKEWMRICFELLDMLKSSKKKIRIAANETFGHISKTIGPLDIIVMLLNNLRVQDRQLRVCTAVAIGIVAEKCEPFTVLPAIMNEYRICDKNIQNGVLKALCFLFEYISGIVAKDYIYAITPLLEDALTNRDQVHRQIAATVIKHMALNSFGSVNDQYDVFIHFLNLIFPNIYETSPHLINRILESIDSLRVVIGVGLFSTYIWAGLFHPAKKVRIPYWKMFNSLYVHCGDSIVPCYPRIHYLPDTQNFSYNIDELDIFL